MIEIIEPNFKFEDERGKLTQLVNNGFKQINVIESKAGAKRGGHYHKQNIEAFFIIDGSLELIVKKDDKSEKYVFGKGEMFLIQECVIHDFSFLSDTILISLYSNGVELSDGVKDIYKS